MSQYPRYSPILADMEEWSEQKSLAFQEKVLNTPVLGRLILKIAPNLSHLKVVLQSWVFRQLEEKKS